VILYLSAVVRLHPVSRIRERHPHARQSAHSVDVDGAGAPHLTVIHIRPTLPCSGLSLRLRSHILALSWARQGTCATLHVQSPPPRYTIIAAEGGHPRLRCYRRRRPGVTGRQRRRTLSQILPLPRLASSLLTPPPPPRPTACIAAGLRTTHHCSVHSIVPFVLSLNPLYPTGCNFTS